MDNKHIKRYNKPLSPQEESSLTKKRIRKIALGIIGFLVLLTVNYIHALKTQTAVGSNVLIFALVNINIIALVILIVLILRNLIKLYFERKGRIIGSKFRTKLVIAFIGLTLVPTILLFLVASGLITSSIESWFNLKVENSLKESLEVAQNYYLEVKKNALLHAKDLGQIITSKKMLNKKNQIFLQNTIDKRRKEFSIDGLQVFSKDLQLLAFSSNPEILQDISDIDRELLQQAATGKEQSYTKSLGIGEVVRGIAPVTSLKKKDVSAIIVVTYYAPISLVSKMDSIRTAFVDYRTQKIQKNPIKLSYVLTFLMITLLIIFSAIWFGFYLAKGITIPIQELAEGTHAIAQGNLDFKIETKADDEIGILVDSFNQMTEDLRKGKRDIEKANEDLMRTNIELDQRRSYMEIVLENIATGVISMDKYGRITTINKSAERMLEISPQTVSGEYYRDIFESEQFETIRVLIKRMFETNKTDIESQIKLTIGAKTLTLLINISLLNDRQGKYLGMVIVFEDLTEMIKAQKVSAWKEVAQRIAHEIKNPLTPIQLSAQRLRKKFQEKSPDFDDIFDGCTNTIINEVGGLKRLVDEFSRFARMPALEIAPAELSEIINDIILLYKTSHKNLTINTCYDKKANTINMDKEQMRRVFINLVENSIEAMKDNGDQISIDIKTSTNNDNQTLTIEFCDKGKGINIKDRDKLFLPYFSTKKDGTGLGLAIVNNIISEHKGKIRVEDNIPRGTRVIIDLPC